MQHKANPRGGCGGKNAVCRSQPRTGQRCGIQLGRFGGVDDGSDKETVGANLTLVLRSGSAPLDLE